MNAGGISYVGLIAAAAIALAGCSSTTSSTTAKSEPKSEAELLAQIQKGEPVNADDPLVATFNRLLAEIGQKCRRQSADATYADMTVNSRDFLKKHGIEESLEAILKNVTGSIASRKLGVSCTEVFALYISLRDKEPEG